MREICLKAAIKTPEGSQWHRFGIFIVSFKQVLHIVLHINFEQANGG